MIIPFIICLFFSCRTFQQGANIIETNISNQFNEIKKADAFVDFLKKKLPKVNSGMTLDEVSHFLEMETRFRGMVTSEGPRGSFKYYYDLKGYQLILIFDYNQHQLGQFVSYTLEPISS